MDNIKKHLINELASSKINVRNPNLYNEIFGLIKNIKNIEIKIPKTINDYYELKTAAQLIEKIINMFPARMITTTSFLEDHLVAVKVELIKIRRYIHDYIYGRKHNTAKLLSFHKKNPIDELLHVAIKDDNKLEELARDSLGKLPKFIKQPNVPQTIITRGNIIPISDYLPISKIKKPNIILDMRTRDPVFYNPYLVHSKQYLKENKLFIEGDTGISSHVITATKTIYKKPVNKNPNFPFKIPKSKVYIAETFDGNTARYLGYNEIKKIDPDKLKPDPLPAKYNQICNNNFAEYIGKSIKISPATVNIADIRRHIYNKINYDNIKDFRSILVNVLSRFIINVNYSIRDKLKEEAMLSAAHIFTEIITKVNIAEVKPKSQQLMDMLEDLINDKSNLFTIIKSKAEILSRQFQ